MGHFWCLPAMDLWLNGPKMAWILDLTWVKYIQVEWAPFLGITASLTVKSLKIMPKMAQTMAIFRHKWLIKWQKNYSHQYPVANELWSTFDPNRISGSTSTPGLLHSLTSPLKQIRSFVNSHLVVEFGTNSSGAIWWPNLQLIQVVPSGGHVCNHSCKRRKN